MKFLSVIILSLVMVFSGLTTVQAKEWKTIPSWLKRQYGERLKKAKQKKQQREAAAKKKQKKKTTQEKKQSSSSQSYDDLLENDIIVDDNYDPNADSNVKRIWLDKTPDM